VARNGPDQLKTAKETGDGLLNNLELAAGNVLELALKSGQELDKVLGLGVLLLELFLLVVEGLQAEALDVLGAQNLNDKFKLG